MIHVLVVDDHPVVREGWKRALEEHADIRVTGEAGSAAEAQRLLVHHRYDVAVLDISMPGRSGLDLLGDLRNSHPDMPVIIATLHSEEHYAIRVMRAGAAGFLNKDAPPNALVDAVRRVASGHKYVTDSLAERMALNLDSGYREMPHERLSDREYQVLCMLAMGKKAKDIADTLSLSPKTISEFRSRILAKMEMESTADIIRYAVRHDLVE